MRDEMHDWVEANHRMAKVLKAKGYDYQYLFWRGAGHGVGNAQTQFLPHALEWVWKGYARSSIARFIALAVRSTASSAERRRRSALNGSARTGPS
jgi:hypothetical protein